MSNNDYRWVDIEHGREVIGFMPEDRAENGHDYGSTGVGGFVLLRGSGADLVARRVLPNPWPPYLMWGGQRMCVPTQPLVAMMNIRLKGNTVVPSGCFG
jgi:hypothetical protein